MKILLIPFSLLLASDIAFAQCKNVDPKANKELVTNFYQDVLGAKKFDLVDNYVAQDLVEHSHSHPVDGIEDFRRFLQGPIVQGTPNKVDIKRMGADGDLVWSHVRWVAPALNKTFAKVDILRINCDGKIAEHWDVVQDTNVETKNPHPFF